MTTEDPKRVGVFIDGTYFGIINSFYSDHHPVKAPIDHQKLLSFLEYQIPQTLQTPKKPFSVTQCRMYLGLPAHASIPRMIIHQTDMAKIGVDLQHFPVKRSGDIGKEQGVDVALATDAAMAASKLDVYVLMTGDGDFIPLVDKLRSAGKCVILAYWNVGSRTNSTHTNHDLMRTATCSMNVAQMIDTGLRDSNKHVRNIFGIIESPTTATKKPVEASSEFFEGVILDQTLNGGVIRKKTNGKTKRSARFLKEDVIGASFLEFEPGRKVRFSIVLGKNIKQRAINVQLIK